MNDLALLVTRRLVITLMSFVGFVLTTSTVGIIPEVSAQSQLLAVPAATLSVAPISIERRIQTSPEFSAESIRAWKRSLIPLAASQTLDITSSYGMRELNPLLVGADGRFGAKAATIKLGTTGAIVGIEYLIIKKWPKSARLLSKLNWSSSILTAGLAVHNYAIK